MTVEFREFLKSNGLYERYIKNNKGEGDNPYVYFDFHWDSSPEGYDFWNNWDKVWFDYLYRGDK